MKEGTITYSGVAINNINTVNVTNKLISICKTMREHKPLHLECHVKAITKCCQSAIKVHNIVTKYNDKHDINNLGTTGIMNWIFVRFSPFVHISDWNTDVLCVKKLHSVKNQHAL